MKWIRPYYRSGKYKTDNNNNKKKSKKSNWFRKGEKGKMFKSVIFVEATPEDKLLKMLKSTEEKFKISQDYRVKFVSTSGTKLKKYYKEKIHLNINVKPMVVQFVIKIPKEGLQNAELIEYVTNVTVICVMQKVNKVFIMEKAVEIYTLEVKNMLKA